MTRFLWLDAVYPDAWSALPHATYDEWFAQCFGTADYWDIALRTYGHESDTLINNAEFDILGKAAAIQPDVLCVQNVGLFPPHLLRARGIRSKLIAFCSYAADGLNLHGWDVVFSSFKWLAEALNRDGQRAVYLPLAFGRPVLERVKYDGPRDIPVAFFGGLGSRIWRQGTETMAMIADLVPEFKWWGYRIERLPESLERSYQGPAWGQEYFRLLMRTRICLNRHGEIAKGEGNSMRQYEAPACGSYLLTDQQGELYSPRIYTDADDAVKSVRWLLDYWSAAEVEQAENEGRIVLENHCYENRVPAFLEAVNGI